MNRITRNALAGALAAAVALGAAAPAAVAAPKAGHTKTHKHAKAAKADRLSAAERKLAKLAGAKSRYLVRLSDSRKVTRLEDTVEQAVQLNIADDVSRLQGMKDAAASTDVKTLSRSLRAIRPEVYNTIVNDLRLAAVLRAALTDMVAKDSTLATQLDPLVAELDTLIATLSGYDASTSRADLRTAKRQLSGIAETVEGDESDDTEAPDTEAPDTEAPDTDTGTPVA